MDFGMVLRLKRGHEFIQRALNEIVIFGESIAGLANRFADSGPRLGLKKRKTHICIRVLQITGRGLAKLKAPFKLRLPAGRCPDVK
jgi:hypothetical protein